jgi:hypothetical protein
MFYPFRQLPINLCGLLLLASVQITSAEDVLPSPMDLQQAYIEANGGLANIQALSSLILDGVMTNAEGEAYEFKLYKKRPDLMRMQIDLPQGSQWTVFDGRRGFELLLRQGEAARLIELDVDASEKAKFEARMDGIFYHLRGRSEWFEVVSEVEIEGKPAFEIVISEAADLPYERLWIGTEHFQEVKLRRKASLEAGRECLEEIYFSDFEQIRGVWLAKTVRFERDGNFFQSVCINKVRANVGLFDSLFKKPKI